MTFSRKRKHDLHIADPSSDASRDIDEQNWKWFKRKMAGVFMTVVSLGMASFLSWFAYEFWQHGTRLTTLEDQMRYTIKSVDETKQDTHDLRVHFLGERQP